MKSKIVGVKFTEEFKAIAVERAKELNLPLATYIKFLINQDVEKAKEIKEK